jgi:hypothetical protein
MKRGPRIGFGIANLGVAAITAWVVLRGLPTRWWPVDVTGLVLAALMFASGAALLAKARFAATLTRAAAGLSLACGLVLVLGLASSAAFLWGTYQQVGRGGAAIFGFVILLAVPYLVVLPAAELVWIGPKKPS